MNGDEGGDARFRGAGPGYLGERTGTPSWQSRWQSRWKQDTASQKEMWHGFGQQPGTHLRWETAWGRRAELRTTEQQTIASLRGSFRGGFGERMTFSAGGRSFTVNKLKIPNPGNPPSWPPGIAEIVGHPEASSHKPSRAVRARVKSLRELVDETGTPVLYTTGMHFNHRAEAYITFPDQRRLQFPVQGIFKAHAIMTAVDQDGNNVAQYRAPSRRIFGQAVEITVHPDWKLTDELVLAIAVSAPWLHWYFFMEGGG